MSCVRTAFLLLWATAGAVTAVAADTPGAASEKASARSPILVTPPAPAPVPAPSEPAAAHAMSSDTAAKLAAVAPKFTGPAAKPDSAEPAAKAAESPDLRDIDKPRNTIIRLPSYMVQEQKQPLPTERDVLTPKGRIEEGYKKHPGLHLGSFWIFSNDGIAMAMQAEDERLERKQEFQDLASLLRFSDPAAYASAKQEVQRAFMREPDFGH